MEKMVQFIFIYIDTEKQYLNYKQRGVSPNWVKFAFFLVVAIFL
jgi:hypothetical protein